MVSAILSTTAFFRQNLDQAGLPNRLRSVTDRVFNTYQAALMATVDLSSRVVTCVSEGFQAVFITCMYGLDVALGIFLLRHNQIVDPQIQQLVYQHQDPMHLRAALQLLKTNRILTEGNIVFIANHSRPDQLANVLVSMHAAGILTDENRALLKDSTNPISLAEAFITMHAAGILTDDNKTALIANSEKYSITEFSRWLNGAKTSGCLNQTHFNYMMKSSDPVKVAKALIWLSNKQWCSDEIIALICSHRDPEDLARAFNTLDLCGRSYEVNIFTPENITSVAKSYYPTYHVNQIIDRLITEKGIKTVRYEPWKNWTPSSAKFFH